MEVLSMDCMNGINGVWNNCRVEVGESCCKQSDRTIVGNQSPWKRIGKLDKKELLFFLRCTTQAGKIVHVEATVVLLYFDVIVISSSLKV